MGSEYGSPNEDSPKLLYMVGNVIMELMESESFGFYRDCRTTLTPRKHYNHPEFHLFIFAILVNSKALSLVFLRRGTNQTGTSLFGSALLKALTEKAAIEEKYSSNETLQEELILHSQDLEKCAI